MASKESEVSGLKSKQTLDIDKWVHYVKDLCFFLLTTAKNVVFKCEL